MCKFFSFVGDGYGNFKYATKSLRAESFKDSSIEPDSHTWILTHYKVPVELQDKWSRYEYNPLTQEFTIDQGVEGHNHEEAEKWAKNRDFLDLCYLIVKPIVHPFKDRDFKGEITPEIIELVKEWDSVWDSVTDSVWDSVTDSVRDSVTDSVGDSVWAYISSFFDIKFKYDFSSCIKLWEMGLIPSYDGKKWRLHAGEKAKIVWEGEV